MNKKHGIILIGAILIVLILAVELTAPPTNSNGTKTFSNGGISFEYPQDLSESSVLLNQITTLDFEGILLGNTLGDLISDDAGYNLQVDKYSLSSFYANSTQDVLDEEKAELEDKQYRAERKHHQCQRPGSPRDAGVLKRYRPENIFRNSCKGSNGLHTAVQPSSK
jgi:hypothetical protein